MTARVRSRAILSSKLKIRKNVIKDEIDHNGAYLCVHKLLELQYLRHCGLKLVCEGQKKCFTNRRQKWRRFCFVDFYQSKDRLSRQNGRHFLFCRLRNSVSSLAETRHFSLRPIGQALRCLHTGVTCPRL